VTELRTWVKNVEVKKLQISDWRD